MARQSRGRSSAAPRAAPAPAQTRSAHTAAAPAGYGAAHHAPAPPAAVQHQAQPQQPGMLASMAATAGSVAAGSVIGHGISSMLFGGGGGHAAAASEAPAAAPPVQHQQSSGIQCEVQAKDFTKCLEKADLPSCQWYLDQLKACQAAAAPY
ncbi:hypothetical protein MD484_g4916, partial [Candolleomyces efflorescens]